MLLQSRPRQPQPPGIGKQPVGAPEARLNDPRFEASPRRASTSSYTYTAAPARRVHRPVARTPSCEKARISSNFAAQSRPALHPGPGQDATVYRPLTMTSWPHRTRRLPSGAWPFEAGNGHGERGRVRLSSLNPGHVTRCSVESLSSRPRQRDGRRPVAGRQGWLVVPGARNGAVGGHHTHHPPRQSHRAITCNIEPVNRLNTATRLNVSSHLVLS